MTNPFDQQDAQFFVVKNEEGQHALWPVHIAVPDGWTVALDASDRAACTAYIDSHWVDMRPRSLVE